MESEGCCVFHHKSWRGKLQRLLNTLRGRLLSSQHIKLFPRAVCTCKASRGIKTAPLEAIQEWMKGKSTNEIPAEARPLIVDMLREVESGTSQFSDSILRALTVVKAATEDDFSALSSHGKGGAPLEQLPHSLVFELPLSSSHLGLYFGRSGSKIKPVYQQFGVRVHVSPVGGEAPSRRAQRMYAEKLEARVEGSKEVEDHLATVKRELISRAQTVQEERQKHEGNVAKYYQARSQRRLAGQRVSGSSYGHMTSAKQAAMEHFEKKQQNKKPKGQSSDKKSGSALSGGHCLHCVMSYEPGQTEEGACSYHDGFLIPLAVPEGGDRAKWSCCDLLSVEPLPTHETHSKTGCSSGRHVWRPGKASKSNTTKPILRESDFTVH